MAVVGTASGQETAEDAFDRYIRRIALRKPEQFARLDAVVRNATHGMRIQAVTIFDSRENIISYSTVATRIGRTGVVARECGLDLPHVEYEVVASIGKALPELDFGRFSTGSAGCGFVVPLSFV